MTFAYIFHIPNYVEYSNGIKILWEAAFQFSRKRRVMIKPFHAGELKTYEVPEKYKSLIVGTPVIDWNVVAIYPDMVKGNPLKAKRVARYMLAKEFILNGESMDVGEADFVFAYSKAVSPAVPQYSLCSEDLRYLKQFRSAKKTGKKICIYYGKSRIANVVKGFSSILEHFEDIAVVTRAYPDDKKVLYSTIAESDLFVSFDPLTSLCHESTLLGTPVLIMDDAFRRAYEGFNYELPGFFYSDSSGDIDSILKSGQDIYVKANNILREQLCAVEGNTEHILRAIEAHFAKRQFMDHAIVSEEGKAFYINTWKCSPIMNATSMPSVYAYHLINRVPQVYVVLRVGQIYFRRLMAFMRGWMAFARRLMSFRLPKVISDGEKALLSYAFDPEKHIAGFMARGAEGPVLSVKGVLRPNPFLYKLFMRVLCM